MNKRVGGPGWPRSATPVVLPDLFSEGGPRKCLKATFQALQSGRRGARPTRTSPPPVSGSWTGDDTSEEHRGIIGFCMGGRLALMCGGAEARGSRVAAENYGMLPSSPEALEGACPITSRATVPATAATRRCRPSWRR